MESNNTCLLTVKYHTPIRLCCRHTHTACLYAVCVCLQQRRIGETSLFWLISYTFPTSVIAYSSSSYIVSFVLMNLSEYCHLKECDTVAALVVLLIYWNACDATQWPCDVTRSECVLWRQVTRYEYSLEKNGLSRAIHTIILVLSLPVIYIWTYVIILLNQHMVAFCGIIIEFRQPSNISHTKSQKFNVPQSIEARC